MATRRYGGSVPRIFGWHQRSADDTGRRWDSLTQRRAAPTSRSFRLLAACAVLQRRPLTREASGKSEGDDVCVGIGIKPVSRAGSVRLIHSAIAYAIQNQRKSVTLVHKGNIMKFTEGAFRDWGYEIAKQYFHAKEIDGGPWCKIPMGKPGAGIVIKDAIADITLQQVLLRPEDFDRVRHRFPWRGNIASQSH